MLQEEKGSTEELKKVPKVIEDEDFVEEKEDDGLPKISKRKLKELSRYLDLLDLIKKEPTFSNKLKTKYNA